MFIRDSTLEFLDGLQDPEYRHEFVDENVGVGLAFQLRRMRKDRNWTQVELAQRTNKAQETISQLEDPNYGRYSLRTLKKLATAFDVALLVRFVPFSELAEWTVNLTPQRLAPPSYEEERRRGSTGFTIGGGAITAVAGNLTLTSTEHDVGLSGMQISAEDIEDYVVFPGDGEKLEELVLSGLLEQDASS